MRVHNLENVSKALDFLKEMHIHLENIGPIDIVDGNAHLILGLIWTFILHFQVRRGFLSTRTFTLVMPCLWMHKIAIFTTAVRPSPHSVPPRYQPTWKLNPVQD